jgi:hypothetical protein
LTLAGLGVLAGILYLTLFADWFVPRSVAKRGVISELVYQTDTEEFTALDEAMRAKYGPDVETVFHSDEGVIVKLNGVVVERPVVRTKLLSIFGMIVIANGPERSRFPFRSEVAEQGRARREPMGPIWWDRFKKDAPGWFDITNRDWRLVGCRSLSAPVIGAQFVNDWLQLGTSDVCEVQWLADHQATMLVGAGVASGGDWVRYVSRRVCRSLAEDWLRHSVEKAPNYVACTLVFDADHAIAGAAKIWRQHVFEVRAGGGLAVLD